MNGIWNYITVKLAINKVANLQIPQYKEIVTDGNKIGWYHVDDLKEEGNVYIVGYQPINIKLTHKGKLICIYFPPIYDK